MSLWLCCNIFSLLQFLIQTIITININLICCETHPLCVRIKFQLKVIFKITLTDHQSLLQILFLLFYCSFYCSWTWPWHLHWPWPWPWPWLLPSLKTKSDIRRLFWKTWCLFEANVLVIQLDLNLILTLYMGIAIFLDLMLEKHTCVVPLSLLKLVITSACIFTLFVLYLVLTLVSPLSHSEILGSCYCWISLVQFNYSY